MSLEYKYLLAVAAQTVAKTKVDNPPAMADRPRSYIFTIVIPIVEQSACITVFYK